MRSSLLIVFSVLALAPACRRAVPATPPPMAALQPIEVLKGGRWLFTYVGKDGRFETTDKPEIVPPEARKIVRVLDPSRPVAERQDLTQVYVADVDELLRGGKTRARPLPRDAFETAAMMQLPPGESSLRAGHEAALAEGTPPGAPGTDGGMPAAPVAGTPVVTVYGTSWCGACRSARQYLTQRRIPFADKDIERDPAAARELQEKAARFGIPTDRVPILDVRGRLLLGFDKARVEALLGETT